MRHASIRFQPVQHTTLTEHTPVLVLSVAQLL